MKTFKEFRTEWILDPSKEMIIESEILNAYDRHKLNLLTIPVVVKPSYCDCIQPSLQNPISETEYECFDCGKEVKQ